MTRRAFLRNARRLGLSAREGADLYSVRRFSGACEAFQGRLQAQRRELRRRIAVLEARHEEVTKLLLECWRQDRSEDCRVRWTLAAVPAEVSLRTPLKRSPARKAGRGRAPRRVRRRGGSES